MTVVETDSTRVVPSTILVVDDEPSVLAVMSRALVVGGLDSATAQTAAEAFRLLEERQFGCLLTDKNLPDSDGLAVIRRMRDTQPYCACILMTAYASTQSAIEALRLGADDYFEKPFPNVAMACERIEGLVRRQRLAYQKDILQEQMGRFEAELDQKDRKLNEQRTEIELFNAILESRVQAATEDLRRQMQMLQLSGGSAQAGDFMTGQLEEMLDYLRSTRFDSREPIEKAMGVLSRIIRRLEYCLETLRGNSRG